MVDHGQDFPDVFFATGRISLQASGQGLAGHRTALFTEFLTGLA